MTAAYKILFAVDLQHDYYINGKCTDINLRPSAETYKLLKNRQILYKMVGNTFLALIKVKDKNSGTEANKPFVSLSPDEKFVFYLQLEKPVFTTITNLDNDLFGARRFYFSNIFETKVDTNLHLSAPVDQYDNGTNYYPGEMVRNGTGATFECIKATTGHNTGKTEFWFAHGMNAYVTKKDMIPILPRLTSFNAKTQASVFDIKLFGFNSITKLFDKEVSLKESRITTGNEPGKNVSIDMQNLPEGRYIIKINGEDYENGTDEAGHSIPFYLSNEMVYNSYLGIVEIFNHQAADPAFSVLDTEGKVKNKLNAQGKSVWLNYVIKFASKMATWKYVAAEGKINAIKDESAGFIFNKTTLDQKDVFQSNIPIRLQEKPVLFDLILTQAVSSQPPPAPNPNPQVTGLISRINTDYFCTINLNY